MEFIPLERYSKNKKGEKSAEKQKPGKKRKLKEDETEETVTTKTKLKPRPKVIEKKNVKNKYRETLSLKKKIRVPKKKSQKKKKDEEEEEDEGGDDDDDDDDDDDEEMEGEEMDVEKEEDEEEQEDEEQEDNEDTEAYKRKCKEIDEKKKNRLFIKLKKKILNEAQVKDLHPDIRSVIFPRKKNSRWCWAVFVSEERADEAMKKLIKNKDVIVSKPTPYNIVSKKNKDKLKTILRKKEARKKVQNMWM